MRWIDKPRKVTRRQIVLEYIKFIKIMGLFHKLEKYMYDMARSGGYIFIMDKGYPRYHFKSDVIHKQSMIGFFETQLSRYCGNKLDNVALREFFIRHPLDIHDYNKSLELTELLILYLKEKHLNNCIIIG